MELDIDYAALKLMEILFERELINYQRSVSLSSALTRK